jgi:hypothetical protein
LGPGEITTLVLKPVQHPVVFAPGEITKSFPFTVTQWPADFRLTLEAALDGETKSATLLQHPMIKSVILQPATTVGNTTQATVTLTRPAVDPIFGTITAATGTIAAVSGQPGVVQLFFSLGQSSVTVPITVTGWSPNNTVTVRANVESASMDAVLTHQTINIQSVIFDPPFTTNDISKVTVRLTAVPVEQVTVPLTGTGFSSAVTIPAGQQEATTSLQVPQWSPADTYVVQATFGNSLSATLSRIKIAAFDINPKDFTGDLDETVTSGTITLNRPAPVDLAAQVASVPGATHGHVTPTSGVVQRNATKVEGVMIEITQWMGQGQLLPRKADIRATLGNSTADVTATLKHFADPNPNP